MLKKIKCSLFVICSGLLLIPICDTKAQRWTIYNTVTSDISDNTIYAIVVDKTNNIWLSTKSGLTKFNDFKWEYFNNYSTSAYNKYSLALDTNNNVWLTGGNSATLICNINKDTCYSHTDSIYQDSILYILNYFSDALAIDAKNNIYLIPIPIQPNQQLIKFDGVKWFSYTGFPSFFSSGIYPIAIDVNQNVWFGSTLTKFDGSIFTQYATGLKVSSINIDSNGVLWLGSWLTPNGLVKFKDSVLVEYNTINSGIPSNVVRSIAIDATGNKWLGTDYGLAKFDNVNWTVYTKSNSPLPTNNINVVAVDKNGKILIGTQDEGLVIFDEKATSIDEKTTFQSAIEIYPNPSSGIINIRLKNISANKLSIYNVLGEKVSTLNAPVSNNFNLDLSGLPSGAYLLEVRNKILLSYKKLLFIN